MKESILEAKELIKDIDGTIIHSDMGSQYTSKGYKTFCEEIGLTPSMSRKATPTDNGQTENIFSCLVREKLSKGQIFRT